MSTARKITSFIVNWLVSIGIAFVLISLLHRWAVTSLGNRTLYASMMGIDSKSDESIRNEFFCLVAVLGTSIALIDPVILYVRKFSERKPKP
jgi:hypothetical protein